MFFTRLMYDFRARALWQQGQRLSGITGLAEFFPRIANGNLNCDANYSTFQRSATFSAVRPMW